MIIEYRECSNNTIHFEAEVRNLIWLCNSEYPQVLKLLSHACPVFHKIIVWSIPIPVASGGKCNGCIINMTSREWWEGGKLLKGGLTTLFQSNCHAQDASPLLPLAWFHREGTHNWNSQHCIYPLCTEMYITLSTFCPPRQAVRHQLPQLRPTVSENNLFLLGGFLVVFGSLTN